LVLAARVASYRQLCCVAYVERPREVPYIGLAVGPGAAAATSIRQPAGDQLRQEVIARMSNETEASTD